MSVVKRFAATALLLAGSAVAEELRRIPQEVYSVPAPQSLQVVLTRKQGSVEAAPATLPAPEFRLPTLTPKEHGELSQHSKDARLQKIGVNRIPAAFLGQGIGSADLEWSVQSNGGYVGRLTISSTGAGALRTRLMLHRIPQGTGMRFRGSGLDQWNQTAELTFEQIARRGNPLWSPLTTGDSQQIEFLVRDRSARQQLEFELTAISHLPAFDLPQSQKDLTDVGRAGYCNLDVNCFDSSVIQQIAHSTAKIVFSDLGGTFLCSGSLLTDTDTSSFIPYFHTAAHCVDSAESAGSVQSFWSFSSTSCNSETPRAFQTLFNGAQLLYTDAASDVTLLRLNDQPPVGSVFSGWDPNPLAVFSDVISVHHPQGDLKKISLGQQLGTDNRPGGANDLYYRVVWNQGITENGSSGAGLYTTEGQNFYLQGGLWGGSSSCYNPGGADLFSRFDLAFPTIKAYLDPNVTASPETGAWWNPAQSGRGFMLEIQNGVMFMSAFLYAEDGRATSLGAVGPMTGSSAFQGNLDRYEDGQTLIGSYQPPVQIDTGGDISLHFSTNDRATLTWPGGTMEIERFRFSSAPRSGGITPETGWWWNPAEPGRGFALDLQGDTLIFSGYMYDEQGDPIWYWTSGLLGTDNRFQGNWSLYAGGQTLTGPYRAPTVIDDDVGTVRLEFLSTTSASLTLPDGRVIQLTRYRF